MANELTGRVAVVTGGGQGMGAAIAQRLAGAFLLSDAASDVTGAAIPVDGGVALAMLTEHQRAASG